MKISIVTVSYNAAATIEQTICSVAGQTHPDIEYIVIDGGSTDGTVALVRKNENTVGRWISEPDDGLYDAMNKGLRLATGDVVGFLNADDQFAAPDIVSTVAQVFDESRPDAVFCDVAIVDRSDCRTVKRFYAAQGFRPWQFRFGHAPPHPGAFVRRDRLIALGGFDTRFRICADFDLLMRLYLQTPEVCFLPRTAVLMRSGGLSTRDIRSTVQNNREKEQICRKSGIYTNAILMWMKYFLKVGQIFRRSQDLN